MRTKLQSRLRPSVAATLAGEDIACGDYVGVMSTTYELPTYLWDSCSLPAHELVRLRLMTCDGGEPLKVFAVCLPFVYVKTVKGEVRTLDMRRTQIVRLDRTCAKHVWRALKGESKSAAH